jgi:hypothetical protein
VKAARRRWTRPTSLAQAWLYAGGHEGLGDHVGDRDLGYSSFMRQVVDTLAGARRRDGRVEQRLRLDRPPGRHVLARRRPGNGALADPTGFRWVRANVTSWGTHNMFTIPGEGRRPPRPAPPAASSGC